MFKKIITATLVISFVIGSFSPVYGDAYVKRGYVSLYKKNFEIIGIDSSKTFNKERSIYIKGEQGTTVSLLLYYLQATQEESIVYVNKVSSDQGEWTKYSSKNLSIGEAGFSAETVTLKIGKNKLVFHIKDSNGNEETKEVYIEVADEKELTEAISDLLLGDIDLGF